jgi:serine/threonine-protein kinase
MELLVGSTLTDLLDDGPMPLPWVLRVCAEVAAALAAAHEQGVVHRDVKPANVMVTASGTAKVVDFGVAAAVGDPNEADAVLFGTPAYVAPERLRGGPVAAGTDMYGLGVLLYRMLAGHMPWPTESTTQMLVAHLHLDPDPLPPLRGLPADVADICAACLAKEPADRPAAAEFASVLAAAAAAHATPVARRIPPAVGSAYARDARRRRSRQLATAVGAVAVITAAVVAAAGGPPGGTPPAGSAPIVATEGDTGTATAPPDPGAGEPATEPSTNGVAGEPDAGAGGGLGANQVDPRQPYPPTVVTTTAPAPAQGPAEGPEPEPDPVPVERSAALAGNSVTVRCVGATATIISATPAEGWSITRIRSGPADQVNVKFESATIAPLRVTFKSRCNDGVPRINPDTA